MSDPRALLDAYAAEYVYEPDTGYIRGPAAAAAFAALRAVLDLCDNAELDDYTRSFEILVVDDVVQAISAALEADHATD